jgi:hypothetical protein
MDTVECRVWGNGRVSGAIIDFYLRTPDKLDKAFFFPIPILILPA